MLQLFILFLPSITHSAKGPVINYVFGGRGASEILPLQKRVGGGGAGQVGKVLATLKGGTKSFRVVLTQTLQVLAIRGRGQKVLPCL